MNKMFHSHYFVYQLHTKSLNFFKKKTRASARNCSHVYQQSLARQAPLSALFSQEYFSVCNPPVLYVICFPVEDFRPSTRLVAFYLLVPAWRRHISQAVPLHPAAPEIKWTGALGYHSTVARTSVRALTRRTTAQDKRLDVKHAKLDVNNA